MSTWVNMLDMAKHLGLSISKFKGILHTGGIPSDAYFRHGRTYRFNVALVENALLSKDDTQLEFDFGNNKGTTE